MSESRHVSVRILDANFNRAREALRVMEEFARFGLDDAAVSGSLKELRHELSSAMSSIDGLAAARDIVGDVGREVRVDSEYDRLDAAHVATAAGKRLSEALRAIEEYGKVVDPALGARIEGLRYRAYELERRLALTARACERFGEARLYVLITESLCRSDWFETAAAALRGGADVLQLREKDLSDRELIERARRLVSLCREHQALMIVNDRPDIAAAVGADGVHLGQDDMAIADARRILPPSAVIGVSTHIREQIARAAAACPDYIAVGPMFATETKPQEHIAGPGLLAEARELTSIPLVAIGGVTEHNAARVVEATSCCICVCAAVAGSDDAESAARRLRGVGAGFPS